MNTLEALNEIERCVGLARDNLASPPPVKTGVEEDDREQHHASLLFILFQMRKVAARAMLDASRAEARP